MTVTACRRARVAAVVATVAVALAVGGCTARSEKIERTADHHSQGSSTASPASPASGGTGTDTGAGTGDSASRPAGSGEYAVAAPGPLKAPLHSADVLVTSTRPIPESVRKRVAALHGVEAALPMSFSSLSSNGRTLSIAAADVAEFRRFTPVQSAQSQEVWSRVAGGEVAVVPQTPRGLEQPKGFLRLGPTDSSPDVHIGAYAPLIRNSPITALVNLERAAQLGMPHHNALLVSTGEFTPSALMSRLKKAVGSAATIQTLAIEFGNVKQTAVLTGGSVPAAVGTFKYTPHPDGTVSPDPRWVRTYIRTEQMPLIGKVTGNKGMLPQLRGALDDVVRAGLSSSIHPGQYGGCYVPRFIANDPAKGLSLHSFGIAVDLNVPENERGTVGRMDRRVVAIFKKWGFAWGGDWHYTDPMHFEMDRVVKAAG